MKCAVQLKCLFGRPSVDLKFVDLQRSYSQNGRMLEGKYEPNRKQNLF